MAGKWSTYEIRTLASFRSANTYRARDVNAKLERSARDVYVSHPLLIAPTNYRCRRRHRRRPRRRCCSRHRRCRGITVKDDAFTCSKKL